MTKKIKSLLIVLLLAVMVIIPGVTKPVSAADTNSILVYVDGNQMNFTDSTGYPEVSNSRTMLPFRALVEKLNAAVTWDGVKNQVTGVNSAKDRTVILTVGSTNYTVNNETKVADVAPYIKAQYSRTMVPIRVLSEGMGYDVDYKQLTGTNKQVNIVFDFTQGQTDAEKNDIMSKIITEVENEYRVTDGSQEVTTPPVTNGGNEVINLSGTGFTKATNYDKDLYDVFTYDGDALGTAGEILGIDTKENEALSFVCTNYPQLNTLKYLALSGKMVNQDQTQPCSSFEVYGGSNNVISYPGITLVKGMVLKYNVYDGEKLVDTITLNL